MRRIIEYYDNLSTRNKIIILSICMIIMLLLIIGMRGGDYNADLYSNNLKYKDLNVEVLLNNFTEDYSNRDDYSVVKNIIDKLNSSYNSDRNMYYDYYDAIDKNYSKRISKRNFAKTINNIFYNIKQSNNNYTLKLYRENSVSNIYVVEIVGENTIGYIGIQLDWNNEQYYIFYLQ